jgi:peptidoglycan/xylan/chitin deacetylase (PgdA/CDA1 family)
LGIGVQDLAEIADKLPLGRAALNCLRQRGAAVFMFHRVLPRGESCYADEMVTSTGMFSALLDWISERYAVIELEALAARLGSRPPDGRPYCAITFDDGWKDLYPHALPLLRARSLPATVFLPVRFIGTERHFWQERLQFIWQSVPGVGRTDLGREAAPHFPWAAGLDGRADYAELRRLLMSRPSSEAEEFVHWMAELCPRAEWDSTRAFLTWDEVGRMQDAGISFGSHTLNHVLLTQANAETARMEIEGSRRELQERLGGGIPGFAYPWGAHNARLAQQVADAGYAFAVTTEEMLVRGAPSPWRIPRVFISDSIVQDGKGSFGPQQTNFHLARLGLRQQSSRGEFVDYEK